MRYPSVRSHLKPYEIVARRRTTINHAFAAAIAPNDTYDDELVRKAVVLLGQDPDGELACAYCEAPARTWDHVFATVRDSHFSGFGHRLGNLLPCCKPCNSAKGNKDWQQYLQSLGLADHTRDEREKRIAGYLLALPAQDTVPSHVPEYARLQEVRQQVLALLAEADTLAKAIRTQAI